MIRHAASTLNSPLKTKKALYSCFILVGTHQQCTSTKPPRYSASMVFNVALTSEPSPSNVQEKGNSEKSNNQEWRIYDDPDLINFGAKKHLKETDVPVEAKLATDSKLIIAQVRSLD
ncbi:unnamed protein product [Fasciola hepatica]|uniref:Uncharacterized protein n=1 Tax=Fasciola hepatica TaxID=6192 RepID=A0ABC9HJC1_FASHE